MHVESLWLLLSFLLVSLRFRNRGSLEAKSLHNHLPFSSNSPSLQVQHQPLTHYLGSAISIYFFEQTLPSCLWFEMKQQQQQQQLALSSWFVSSIGARTGVNLVTCLGGD